MSNSNPSNSSQEAADKLGTGFDKSIKDKSFRLPAIPQFTRLPSAATASSPQIAAYRTYEASINTGVMVLDTENDEEMDEHI